MDPIAERFAWVSSYNYVENTPIGSIDLWGLQAYSFHGLFSDGSVWDSPGFMNLEKTLLNSNSWGREFSWKSNLAPRFWTMAGSKGVRQRTRAAKEAVKFIESTFNSGEEITLIGVSDGGNIVFQIAGLLYDKQDIKVNVITVNAPASNIPGHLMNPNNNGNKRFN